MWTPKLLFIPFLLLSSFVPDRSFTIARASDSGHADGAYTQANRSSPQVKWHPAKYRGLQIGKASKRALIARLGKPLRTENLETEQILHYEVMEPLPADAEFRIASKKQRIESVFFYPKNMHRKDIAKVFGDDYVEKKYSFDDCLGSGGDAPIYEDPDGSLEYVEYPAKGIAINVGYADRVYDIGLLSRPPGPKESRCKTKILTVFYD
jgi:hypothetical protein